MKKMLVLISVAVITVVVASPSLAGSDEKKNAVKPVQTNGFWHKFKADWQEIGKNMKDTGVHIGQTFKHEFKEMPQNIRNGYKEAKKDLQKVTASDRAESTNK